MKKEEFEQLKKQTKKDISTICKKHPDTAIYVVIAKITSMADLPGERSFTESQLKEMFELAEESEKRKGWYTKDVLKTQSI